jgi:diacylglycerol kinase (ATP)
MTSVVRPRATGLRRLWHAFRYSLEGLAAALRGQEAFRLEIVVAGLLIPLALLADVGAAGRALLVGSVLAVLVVELINSALEAVVDRISLERHELSKQAKDLGSAAVLVSMAGALAVWLLLLLPRYLGR